jgi:glycosyltransferase involved in cell wall biosynthesis
VKVSIVIPAYNEAKTLPDVLRAVLASDLPGLQREVIVVDDASTDGTRAVLQEAQKDGVRAVFVEKNAGKGAALRRGFEAATGDIVVVQDADLEYDPADFARVVAPIAEGRADVVYGSRFLEGAWTGSRLNYAANRFLTWLSNRVTGLRLTDMETGRKAFRAGLLRGFTLREDRFGFEPEVTAQVAAARARVLEVPCSYHARTRAEGKKIGFRDGVRAIHVILRHRPSARR